MASPVIRLSRLETGSDKNAALWVKRDDRNDAVLGGNKARKLPRLFSEARRRGASTLAVEGRAGSHQVLATILLGSTAGFEVRATLRPQPRTAHAEKILRAISSLASSKVSVRSAEGRRHSKKSNASTFFLPTGGSSAQSLLGHIEAAGELKASMENGEMPIPDLAVVALASAGTAVGLAAGFAELKWPTRVVGVATAGGFWIARLWALLQLSKLAWIKPNLFAGACRRLRIDTRFRGPDYGLSSEVSEAACRLAADSGIHLDPVYGAKAFAAALHWFRENRFRNILFWQTFSTDQLGSLLAKAPPFSDIPEDLKNLLKK